MVFLAAFFAGAFFAAAFFFAGAFFAVVFAAGAFLAGAADVLGTRAAALLAMLAMQQRHPSPNWRTRLWPQEEAMKAVDPADDRYAVFGRDADRRDSHSTLDVEAHWDWRNPLIVLPLVEFVERVAF